MDATLVILHTVDIYYFWWLPHATALDRHISPVCLTGTTIIVPEIHQALQQALEEAAQFLNMPGQPTASLAATSAFPAPLIQLGQALFRQTIPPSIQQAIAQFADQAHIALVTDDADLPWELLHDGQEFLALRHDIGRVLPHSEWPRHLPVPTRSPLKCLLLGNPTGDLPGAATEIEALTELLDRRGDLVQSESCVGSRVTKAQFLQWLASGNYDIIHFAGHARPGALHLADGWLEMPFIQQAVKGQPLIYLNACASARTHAEAMLPHAEQVTQNLASAFLRRGAVAVIGMLWPVPDQSSAALSLDFYGTLQRGATVGEALRQSRMALRRRVDAGMGWLAPVLYGDPRLRPIQAGLIYRPGTVLVVRFPATPGESNRPFDALSSDWQRRLYTLRNLVAVYGGAIAVINSAGLIVLFGVYQAVDQDALAALRAAVEIRGDVLTWGLGAPFIGIASGDLAAEPLSALSGNTQSAWLRQPLLIGAPVTEAVALADNAANGQICVNALTARSTQHRYRFAPGPLGTLLLDEIAKTPDLRPTPAEPQTGTNSGRPRELQRLRDEWAMVGRRQGRVTGIVGEAGIGKTHLLAEFAQALSAAPVQWLALACTPDAQHTPYGLLGQLFRQLFNLSSNADEPTAAVQIQARLTGAKGSLQRNPTDHIALLLDLLGYKQAGSFTPQAELHLGQQAVYQNRLLAPLQFLIDQAVRQQPLVLVVEDTHWLDAASHQVLTHLTDSMRVLPVLLLLSYRPGWEHGWFGKPYYHHLPLDKLEPEASRQLLENHLHSTALPKELLELPERLGGNPLFLIETVRSLQERGILQQASVNDAPPRWLLQQSLVYLQLPDSVQRMIQLRFGQLSEETRRVLEIAAVIGVRFSPTLLAQIAGVAEFDLWRHLDQLQTREFILQDWRSDAYTFRHAAIQEAAYAEVAFTERRVWHARIAQALEQSTESEPLTPDILAQHYYLSLVSVASKADEPLLADDADPRLVHSALTYLLQSGERALARYGLQEAEQAFQRGEAVAALLTHHVDAHYTLHAQLQAGLGSTYDILGKRPQALYHLRQAYALFQAQPLTAESRRLTGDLARRIARLYAWRKEYPTAFSWIEMGLEKVAQRPEAAEQAVAALLHIHAGSIYYNQSDYPAASRVCNLGIAIAQAIQADAVLAEGYHLLGVVARLQSQYDQALEHYAAALDIRQQLGDVYQIARTTGNIGIVYFDKAEWQQARAYYERARAFWQEIGDRDMLAHTSLNLGNVELCMGDWEDAQHYFEEALALWSNLESQRWIALCHNNLGLLAIERAEWAVAREHLTPNLAAPFQDIRLEAHYALAEVALGEQQVTEALTLSQQALVLADGLGSERELAFAQRIAGRALAQSGELDQGRTQLAQSLALFEKTGARYEAARTVYRLAEVEANAGNLSLAQVHCQAALATFQAVQAHKDEERARALQEKLSQLRLQPQLG